MGLGPATRWGMKEQTRHPPTASKFSLVRELCNFIPPHLAPPLPPVTGVEDHARGYGPWRHVVSLRYAQLTQSLELNDLRLACERVFLDGGLAPRSADIEPECSRTRDPKLAEQVFWAVLEHLQTLQPAFGGNRRPKFAFRFTRLIGLVDSTNIQLMARSLNRPVELRRVTALVKMDGQVWEMVLLTNHLEWSAQTIADLCRRRWSIEIFFKELKQTRQPADFLGHSANAVKSQVGTALLPYVLRRCCAHLGQWSHRFIRLFALSRSALWQRWELRSLLEVYGTAGGGGRFLSTSQQACLAGFGCTCKTAGTATP